MPKAADLPNDVEALKSIVLEHSAALAERSAALEVAETLVISQKLELEKLRFEIACLKRMKYARSSEQLDAKINQMQLTLEDLEASLAEKPEHIRPPPKSLRQSRCGARSPHICHVRRSSTTRPALVPPLGALACTIFWQAAQEYLGLTWRITW